jgi:NAD(P)-dependent dehydrogenase (short-subunit alcohol dehydrogenase family)
MEKQYDYNNELVDKIALITGGTKGTGKAIADRLQSQPYNYAKTLFKIRNNMKLPKIIAELIAAQDNYDSKAFAGSFSDDAIVHDEGKTYQGKQRSDNGTR